MGKRYETIDERLAAFIERQHLFFVGTAPLAAEGHVNLSPKGRDSFRILDPLTVAYLDLTGSGVETIAHLRENRRITILFCAFEGPPLIVRLYGTGEVVEQPDGEFTALRSRFPSYDGVRSIIRVRLERITDSCGFGVPSYEYVRERTQMPAWVAKQGPEGIVEYQGQHNRSIDGLPGLQMYD